MGQGVAMAGQSDWEAPVPEERFPLALKYQLISSSFAFITLSSSEMVYRINCLQRASCLTRSGSDLDRDITVKGHLKSWLLIGRTQGI